MQLGRLGASFGSLGVITRGDSGGIILPKLPAGSPGAFLADSMGARYNFFTTSTTRTLAENRHNSEMMFCHFLEPNFIHQNYWDSTATAALRIPTYGDSMASDTFFSGLNFGYSGDTATGARKRVAKVISSGAKFCVVALGTNVGTTDGTVQATVDSLQWIVQTLVAAGVRVILMTIRPRGVSETPVAPIISPASMQRIIDINVIIRSLGISWGASAIADPWNYLVNPAYPPGHVLHGDILPEMAIADKVHISSRGAYYSAYYALRPAIDVVVEHGSWFNQDASVSNMLPNPTFAIATGGNTGGGFTGVTPSGWAVLNNSGAGQPVTGEISVSGDEVVLIVRSSGTGAANTYMNCTFQLNASTSITTGFDATTWISALHHVNVVTPSPILVMLQNTLGMSSTVSARGHGQPTGSFNSEPSPIIDTPITGWISCEPMLMEARTSVNPRLVVTARQDMVGEGVIRVKKPIMRPIPSPQVAYPW